MRWFINTLLITFLYTTVSAQQHIQGFVREFAIQGLPTNPILKSFDVNGDSVSDLLVAKANQLKVFDGRTFNLLFQDLTAPGTANLSQADVNRDGILDLVATNGASSVVVWFGPNFLNRRVFLAPVSSGVFAVRNREDGQVEFTFGFQDVQTTCQPVPDICINDYRGHLSMFIDTTFVFSGSVNENVTPGVLSWEPITPNQHALFLSGSHLTTSCPRPTPGLCYTNLDFQTTLSHAFLSIQTSYDWRDFCYQIATLRAYAVGNIDADSGKELIIFVAPYYSCGSTWSFGVYDILSGAAQWVRTDVRDKGPIFEVDLNGDSIQELLTYDIRSSKPALVEYQASDGATLGFTELPFTPTTLTVGLFGNPTKPKVLLAHADSVVVFKANTPCSVIKGDMNADGNLTIFDVVLELNCVFQGFGSCYLCFADVNCDGILTASDVILEMYAALLGIPFPCP